jgi:P4 family phage/plasmid primase-like protien
MTAPAPKDKPERRVSDYYRAVTAEDICEVARALMPTRVTRLTNLGLEMDCPRHASQSKTSLHVDRARQLWTCFGCGAGGDVIQLVEFVESGCVTKGVRGQMPVSHRRARDWMAARAGLPPLERWGLSEEEAKAVESRREMEDRVFGLLTLAAGYYRGRLTANPAAMDWIGSQWGFDAETVERFTLGFSENTPRTAAGLRDLAHANDFTDDDLVATGLRNAKGGEFFRERLIFPFWHRGRVVFLIGRQTPWTEASEYERAKYRKLRVHNPDDERGRRIAPCITNDVLWGEDALLGRPAQLVITEGVADAVALAVRGVPVVSPATVKFRSGDLERLASRLASADVARVVVCMDNEVSRVGIRSALAIGRGLRRRVKRVGVLALPVGPTQTAARTALLDQFGIRVAAGEREFRKALETLTPERADEARRLAAEAKIDVAEWFRAGGTTEQFLDLARRAPTPLEQTVRDLPQDLPSGDELDDLLEPILAEVATLKAGAQDRVIKLLRSHLGSAAPSLTVLRRQIRESKKARGSAEIVPFPAGGSGPRAVEGERRPLTDTGNAERLIRRHGEDLHYCHPWEKWLIWDGARFRLDERGEITLRAIDTVRSIYGEAENEPEKEERTAVARWARSSEAKARIDSMIGLGRVQNGIPVVPAELDSDPLLLTCQNGTLDLRRGELREHRREDRITKHIPIIFDPSATCPIWDGFVDQIMDGRPELVGFLRRAIGYSLTGDTSERSMFILWGSGANGKSTLLETVRALVGDYGARTPTETLMAKSSDGGIPNDIAKLTGVRFVSASEAEEGKKLAEAKIKDITGGDTITARFMRAEWFEFKPTFKIWLSTNHKPEIKGTDHGIWDRIKLIPFSVRIAPENRDPNLLKKLLGELPGILTWAVRGCLEWQKSGLRVPGEVQDATNEYRVEMDVVASFIEQETVTDVNATAYAGKLYEAYGEWCKSRNERWLTQRAFGDRLRERGFRQEKGTAGRMKWIGIGMVQPVE